MWLQLGLLQPAVAYHCLFPCYKKLQSLQICHQNSYVNLHPNLVHFEGSNVEHVYASLDHFDRSRSEKQYYRQVSKDGNLNKNICKRVQYLFITES